MNIRGYLGIDAGTQGLSVIFTDDSLKILAHGEGVYRMVPDLDEPAFGRRLRRRASPDADDVFTWQPVFRDLEAEVRSSRRSTGPHRAA